MSGRKPRILLVHNRYQQRGGEDSVYESDAALLQRAGYELRRYEVTNDSISHPVRAAIAGLNAGFSRASYRKFAAELAEFKPHIVHVHNFFPLLTPAVHFAAKASGCKVVQTVHNYRAICTNAQLLRNGSPCELCVEKGPFPGVVHACYRNSHLASLGVASMIRVTRSKAWHESVDAFAVLTQFARGILARSGFPERKLKVVPNATGRVQNSTVAIESRGGQKFTALYVGRLSSEKGIQLMLEAWQGFRHNLPQPESAELIVVGDGPLLHLLKGMKGVISLGYQDQTQVRQHMASANVLLLPSQWYEGFPMVVVEAFSMGLPVLASSLGGLPEIVVEGQSGELVPHHDARAWAAALRRLYDDPSRVEALAQGARREFEAKYTLERKLVNLEAIYGELLGQGGSA